MDQCHTDVFVPGCLSFWHTHTLDNDVVQLLVFYISGAIGSEQLSLRGVKGQHADSYSVFN